MGRLPYFAFLILISLLLLRFFQWPFPYYTVADSLYDGIGINYTNLAIDFLVFFLISMVISGLLQFTLFFLITKSLLKEIKSEKDTNAI